MKKIVLVSVPFCTPASPPYAITRLYSFLKKNCAEQIDVLDLNLEFHKLKFPDYQSYYQKKEWDDYDNMTSDYNQLTKKTYAENNKKVVQGGKPEFFAELLEKIKDKQPDIVAFSLVYSSQAFYAYALIKELEDVVTVIGGPAINEKLMKVADKTLKNELEFLTFLRENKDIDYDAVPDFSIYNLQDYFTPEPVIPLKTSTTCFHKGCAFCAHYAKVPYYEYPLALIKETITKSKQKHFFLIDDMISKKRLLELADMFKPLQIQWACQLRPTKDLDYEILQTLKASGLLYILWGVESGSERILQLMHKGTNIPAIEQVLADAHQAKIKNVVFILAGFPTETKEEFLDSITFLQRNEKHIDLVSVSVFGLQKGTAIYNNPEKFGIKNIIEEERTILEPKISYEVAEGLTQKEACKLRDGHKRTIEKINNYPKQMNFFREHMFFY